LCYTVEYDSDDNGSYPVHEAVVKGDCEKILSLLEEGYNVNDIDDHHQSPVHLAVAHKQYDVLKLLLSCNGQPVIEGCSYPLLFATSEDDQECVEVKLFLKTSHNLFCVYVHLEPFIVLIIGSLFLQSQIVLP
jgi:hypothetical protein